MGLVYGYQVLVKDSDERISLSLQCCPEVAIDVLGLFLVFLITLLNFQLLESLALPLPGCGTGMLLHPSPVWLSVK